MRTPAAPLSVEDLYRGQHFSQTQRGRETERDQQRQRDRNRYRETEISFLKQNFLTGTSWQGIMGSRVFWNLPLFTDQRAESRADI